MADGEGKKSYPMLPISHWWTLRKKFRQSIPGVVTDSYLSTVLNMGQNSARANVLPFLKVLGIIDSEGKTAERAKLWRDDQHYPDVCKAILKEVYPDELLHAVPDPVNEKTQAKSWFAQQTGVGEDAASRMVALYTILVEADPTKEPSTEKKVASTKAQSKTSVISPKRNKPSVQQNGHTPTKAIPPQEGSRDVLSGGSQFQSPPVHINLQIHISADASPDQIEQIFASMSKHLYKRG